ncbi:AAA family ATPase, partial [Pseudomonas amygdali]
MLQVFNELNRDKETREVTKKPIQVALKKAMDKKPPDQAIIDECNLKLEAIELGNPIPKSIEDPALPGYLLLIDEPENALHPMAARAAQRHLYKLAENPDWQIMLTTHSPYFINALEDHTTI